MNFYRYFQAYNNYFWDWEDNAEVLAIPGGSTIIYREFLLQILENLSEQGIPPFGSLLLVIIATNNTYENSLLQVNNITTGFIKQEENKIRQAHTLNTLQKTISFLNVLSSLPNQYKEGKLRLYLLQTLFASCHNILSVNNSQNVVRGFTNKFYEKDKLTSRTEINLGAFHRDFWTIGLLLKKFPDTESIINAISNIPEINEEIKLSKDTASPGPYPNDFVEELISNPKTYHIGSLIKRIWAGLKIPYHHVLPSELPLGGVSDITNKGDFDKLLISEFANDDLLFLSRLANNEALFLRREMPPVSDATQRIILLDISMKNWGTPKILAYAILLAIAKHPKTDINCTAFAVGNTFHPILFSNTEEIIRSLAILESTLHSASGLEAFFKTNSNPKLLEIFFITSAETLKLPAMQKILSDFNHFFKYLITTTSTGDIMFFRNHNKNKKLLQELHLNLGDIWQKEIKQPFVQPDTSAYPILFPRQNISKILNTSNGELFVITSEKKIFQLVDNDIENGKKGLKETYINLPTGEYEIGIFEHDDIVLLCYNPQYKELIFINLTTKDTKKLSFNYKKSQNNHFFFFEGCFHLISRDLHWTIQYEPTPEVLKNDSTPDNIVNAHKQRENEILELSKKYRFYTTMLKNIQHVFINNVNNLVFNIHELTLNQAGNYRLQSTSFLQTEISAKPTQKNEFVFPDGSIVKTNRSGMVVLISGDSDIPHIYIPTALDTPLGMATHHFFAGNDYYYSGNNTKIDTKKFWRTNIERFISNIQLNAVKDKAIS